MYKLSLKRYSHHLTSPTYRRPKYMYKYENVLYFYYHFYATRKIVALLHTIAYLPLENNFSYLTLVLLHKHVLNSVRVFAFHNSSMSTLQVKLKFADYKDHFCMFFRCRSVKWHGKAKKVTDC